VAGLTKKQQAFVLEYLIDLNATQAALRSGYSPKTSFRIGAENLQKPAVADAIQVAMAERVKRTEIDADYVLGRLASIDQMDCIDILNNDGSIKSIFEWPKIWRQFVSGVEVAEIVGGKGADSAIVSVLKKIKWPDKIKNLELIGRHVKVQAFSDRLDISGEMTWREKPTEELQKHLERLRNEK
jgi:phage terminase small subunit